MQRFDTFVGALRYEFRMQIRRRSVWITFIALGLFFIVFHQPWYRPITTSAGDAIVYWTGEVQSFLTIAVGILLADRLPRDKRTKVEEVLNTLPGALGARVCGKYLGSTLATLVPMFAVYCVGVGYIISRWHDVQALPIALATFAAIVLPGILFVGAFSIACPAILQVPLYQFLFVGYWFWGNLLPNFGIPTLSETILYGSLNLDAQAHRARLNGTLLDLSPTEFALLHLLLRNPGRAFSRAYLLDTVWGETYVGGDRSVDNAVLRLRKKLGPPGEAIETVWGIGYRLRPER